MKYNVIITNAGPRKIPVIKATRELTGLGLKEAKQLVDSSGSEIEPKGLVLTGAEAADAEFAKERLEEAGATVELVEV